MRINLSASVLTAFVSFILLVAHTDFSSAQEGEYAPDFNLSDMQGSNHSLSAYRGKVVVINFWASWCPECVEELSSLNALYEKYKGRSLMVLGITVDKSRDPVIPILKRSRVTYPILFDSTGGALLRQYRTIGLPYTVVVDKNGHVAWRTIGRTDFMAPDFSGKIENLLGAGTKK